MKYVVFIVSIVGYGTDTRLGDYWLIKNSWDVSWGQNGFGKIARGHNLCQCEATVHYARIKDVRGNICPIPQE
jgi:C1A family cysteine protease